MDQHGSLVGQMALMVLIMGIFIAFVTICGVATAREEYEAEQKKKKVGRDRSSRRKSKASGNG